MLRKGIGKAVQLTNNSRGAFTGRHAKGLAVGAAGLGAWSAHPFASTAGVAGLLGIPTSNPTATGSIVADIFLNDPDAERNILMASINTAVSDTIMSDRRRSQVESITNTNPSGSLVFGLYNERLPR